jgi:hypothetical protein
MQNAFRRKKNSTFVALAIGKKNSRILNSCKKIKTYVKT